MLCAYHQALFFELYYHKYLAGVHKSLPYCPILPLTFLEGLMRDFIRHVQNLRKEVDFNVNDRISLYFEADGELAEAIKTHVDYIGTETLSTVIVNEPIPPDIHAEEIKLGGYIARIGVAK